MGNKVKLGELLSILTDYHANGAYKKLKENVELLDEPDFAVMIRTTNFEQEDFTNNLKYINKHAYSFLAKSKVYPNDIIMNKIANAGSSYLMPDLKVPVSLAMNLFLLRVDAAKANPIYIYLYLRVNEAYVKSFANGSVTKTITKDAVRNLEIELPSRSIQDRIAEQFICINNKITLNRQINQTLEQMAQTLFKSWFVDFDPVVDNALDAGFFEQDLAFSDELLRRVEVRKAVRESDNFKPLAEDIRQLFPNAFEERAEPALGLGGWVPKGWKGQPIKTHCVKIQNGGTPSRSNSDYWDGGNIPWLTSGEVRQSIVTNVENTITDLGLQNSSAKWVSSYSTLVALYGATAGEVSINVDPLTTNQAVCALIPKESYCWFNYLQVRNKTIEMQNQAVGSAQQNISKRLVENLIVISPLPYIVEIFNQRVEPLFLKSIFNQKMAMELTKLRDTLLPKLISGELSLSDIKIDITEEILI